VTPVGHSWVRDGIATLDDTATRLLTRIDEVFLDWAMRCGARQMTLPAVLAVPDLAKLDVYQNFPHLAMVASSLDPERLAAVGSHPGLFEPPDLAPARLGLPSAVCYGVYLHFGGQTLPRNALITAVGTCFRNEAHFDGLRRLAVFRMREIVALADPPNARAHLDRFSTLILAFARHLGLSLERTAASDPFYDNTTPQALWQQAAPVKHEFVCDGLAIASVNEHRTFFGDRCGIRLARAGATFSSSCVAFGLERWIHALSARFDADLEAAREAVVRAHRAVVDEHRDLFEQHQAEVPAHDHGHIATLDR